MLRQTERTAEHMSSRFNNLLVQEDWISTLIADVHITPFAYWFVERLAKRIRQW